jgi:hypothetical protein
MFADLQGLAHAEAAADRAAEAKRRPPAISTDTGLTDIGPVKPSDHGAVREVTAGGVRYTYRRSPGSGSAYVSASFVADNTGNAPSISAYMFADDNRCSALTADEFVAMLRGRFADLVSVLR